MEVVKYDLDVAIIKALDVKYADIVIKDTASYAFVMSGLAEYRDRRLQVDAWYKEKKKGALEYTNALGDERRRVKGLLEPGEQHLKDVRQVEDDRKKAIQDEKDRIEQERIDGIQAKIDELEKYPQSTIGLNSDSVASMCDAIVAVQITEAVYQEFTKHAKEVKLATLSALDDIYNDKVIQEKEAAERKAEIEKLEKIKKENAEAQAKIDKEKADFEKAKKAEKEKQDRAGFERKAQDKADAQAKRQAEEEVQRKEKERIAEGIERDRVRLLMPDKEKLIAFSNILANIELPRLKSEGARKILNEISIKIIELAEAIKGQAETM